MHRTQIRVILLFAIAVVAVACGGGSGGPMQAVATRMRLPNVPPADYYGAAWVGPDALVLGWQPPSLAGAPAELARLVELGPDATATRPLPFVHSTPTCRWIEETNPVALPDGRLGFLRACQPAHEPDLSVTDYDIVAVDLGTGAQEVLAHLGDPSVSDAKVNIYSLSFGSDLSHGMIYVGSKICDSVASFDAAGVHPFDFRLGSGAVSSNLADAFGKPCQDTVNARSAALSPDGTQIALFIAEGAKGSDGEGRLDATWDLVVIRPSDGTLTRMVSNLNDPLQLSWSPDGAWLLSDGPPVGGEPSTMLVRSDMSRQPIRLDLADRLIDPAWAPTGNEILALVDRTDPSANSDAAVPVILDVAKLVGR